MGERLRHSDQNVWLIAGTCGCEVGCGLEKKQTPAVLLSGSPSFQRTNMGSYTETYIAARRFLYAVARGIVVEPAFDVAMLDEVV
jgi:hypothetical protein